MKITDSRVMIGINLVLLVMMGWLVYLNLNTGFMPPPRHGINFDRHHGPDAVYDRLELSEQQRRELENNRKNFMDGMRNKNMLLIDLRKSLALELANSDIDVEKVNALHTQLKDLICKVEDEHLQSIISVRKILGQEKFIKFMKSMPKDMLRNMPKGMPDDMPKGAPMDFDRPEWDKNP